MVSAKVRDFVFRGLLFESETKVFRKAGIQVGSDVGQTEENLLLEALAPFGIAKRNQALEMGRLYSVLHAFENEVRSLVKDTLEEKVGPEWWSEAVPNRVREKADDRRKIAEDQDVWLEGEKSESIEFTDFGDLSDIILHQWKHFKDTLPVRQHWISQRMSELEKARNFVAHNRMLLPSEFQRIYMYVSDWNKVIGL